MTEEQAKFIGKWLVDNYNRPISDVEKELIKQAIDHSQSIQELVSVLLVMMGTH